MIATTANQYQYKINKIDLIKRIFPTLAFIVGVSFVILTIFFMVMFVFLLAINVNINFYPAMQLINRLIK